MWVLPYEGCSLEFQNSEPPFIFYRYNKPIRNSRVNCNKLSKGILRNLKFSIGLESFSNQRLESFSNQSLILIFGPIWIILVFDLTTISESYKFTVILFGSMLLTLAGH